MAESSILWTTGSTGDGASPYTQLQTTDFFRAILVGDQEASQGVLAGYVNQLAVTSGAVDQITVAAGRAIVYGFPYENNDTLNKAIVRPIVDTTGGRVVLRANYSAQTVRVTINRNTDGVAGIPTLTQIQNTTWDIPLATFTITTGGTVTVTDARDYCRYPTTLITDRQGGSASNWGTSGTISYKVGGMKIEVGSVNWSGTAAASGNVNITHATAFADTAMYFATANVANGKVNIAVSPTSSSVATLYWETTDASTRTSVNMNWMAIGPEA